MDDAPAAKANVLPEANVSQLHRILVIVPYYGTYPPLMPLWLRSCAANPTVDWLIISDQPPKEPLPPNVKFERMTLHELWRRAVERLHPDTAFPTPYKLCDWRPMFGVLFAEYIDGYDFWGHCDLDVVFGSIRRFLRPAVLTNHDKILRRGSFSLYRNNPRINHLFREHSTLVDWKKVVYDPVNRVFDERPGIYAIAKAAGIAVYLDEVIADIDPSHRQLRLSVWQRQPNYSGQRFTLRSGSIWQEYMSADGRCHRREFLLIHLQKRKYIRPTVELAACNELEFAPCEVLAADWSFKRSNALLGDVAWQARWHVMRPIRRWSRWRQERALRAKGAESTRTTS